MPGMEDTGSARPHITRVLTDKHHLDYFKEFLRLQDRRLLTLHKGSSLIIYKAAKQKLKKNFF